MELVTLGNRPATLAPKTSLYDFIADNNVRARVSLKLEEASGEKLRISAQAFEVDADGVYMVAPDGRPSRTEGTNHVVQASGLGSADAPKTHTLNPGWVVNVGTFMESTFEPTALRGTGIPTTPPDYDTNPTGQYYDIEAGKAYRWDEGEKMRIARGKAMDLFALVANSNAVAGIDF